MVVEHNVYCRRLIGKLVVNIIKEYARMSNKYNVEIIIVLNPRFASF